MEIKNLEKAADRIKKAIKNKERIILYGDADLDGTTSVIILDETIRNLGGKIASIYFPERETEGYGINETGLNFLQKFSPALLISLDLGIGNVKEVDMANKMGFEVIIIDHHEILDEIPKAKIIVDPKQKGDKSFKGFANVGIVFELSRVLLGKKMTDNLRNNFLELTALATIADMMPKIQENEIYITEGLKNIENSWRPGLKSFFELSAFERYPALNEKITKIIAVLNVRDVQNKVPASFRLLTNSSLEESENLVKKLLEKSEQRREDIKKIAEEIEKKANLSAPIIFEGDANWDYSVMSAAASILCQKFGKPTFIYKKLKDESQGTVRMPQNMDSVAMMKKCKKLLITFGGHALASGFRLKNENLDKFRECLIKNIK
jgi:single-stranded-DNA-specific exonuclease